IDEPSKHVPYGRDRVAFGRASRASQMRPAAENLTDQTRTRAARPNLEENANSILIRLLDHLRKVDCPAGLSGDGGGGRFAVDVIAMAPDSAVKPNALRCVRLKVMQGKILTLDFPTNRTMDRANSGNCEKRRVENRHNFFHSTS